METVKVALERFADRVDNMFNALVASSSTMQKKNRAQIRAIANEIEAMVRETARGPNAVYRLTPFISLEKKPDGTLMRPIEQG